MKDVGNPQALRVMEEVFAPEESEWRGLGLIADSGMKIRKGYAAHDADTV